MPESDDCIVGLRRAIGVLSTKIVGIQYYNGCATEGEFVIIRREPQNPVRALRILLFRCKAKAPFLITNSTIPMRSELIMYDANKLDTFHAQWLPNWPGTWYETSDVGCKPLLRFASRTRTPLWWKDHWQVRKDIMIAQ